MLRDAFYIARMDARYLLSRRETIVWTFAMPVVFFYFIGTITGGNSSPDARDPLAMSVPADAGFLADRLAERLTGRDYRVVRTHSSEEFLSYGRRLEIPSGFTAAVLAGHPMKVRFTRAGEELSRLQRDLPWEHETPAHPFPPAAGPPTAWSRSRWTWSWDPSG